MIRALFTTLAAATTNGAAINGTERLGVLGLVLAAAAMAIGTTGTTAVAPSPRGRSSRPRRAGTSRRTVVVRAEHRGDAGAGG